MSTKDSETKNTQVKPEIFWLSHENAAKSCGISPQAFRRWGVSPVAKIGRQIFYTLADVLGNRLENQATRLEKSVESVSDSELTRAEREEKLLLTKAQRVGQEIKNSQLRKELAPVDVIEWTLGKVGSQIAAILDSIPMQLKKRNPRLTASNIELIKREIVRAQNIAAQVQVDYDEYERNTNK